MILLVACALILLLGAVPAYRRFEQRHRPAWSAEPTAIVAIGDVYRRAEVAAGFRDRAPRAVRWAAASAFAVAAAFVPLAVLWLGLASAAPSGTHLLIGVVPAAVFLAPLASLRAAVLLLARDPRALAVARRTAILGCAANLGLFALVSRFASTMATVAGVLLDGAGYQEASKAAPGLLLVCLVALPLATAQSAAWLVGSRRLAASFEKASSIEVAPVLSTLEWRRAGGVIALLIALITLGVHVSGARDLCRAGLGAPTVDSRRAAVAEAKRTLIPLLYDQPYLTNTFGYCAAVEREMDLIDQGVCPTEPIEGFDCVPSARERDDERDCVDRGNFGRLDPDPGCIGVAASIHATARWTKWDEGEVIGRPPAPSEDVVEVRLFKPSWPTVCYAASIGPTVTWLAFVSQERKEGALTFSVKPTHGATHGSAAVPIRCHGRTQHVIVDIDFTIDAGADVPFTLTDSRL